MPWPRSFENGRRADRSSPAVAPRAASGPVDEKPNLRGHSAAYAH